MICRGASKVNSEHSPQISQEMGSTKDVLDEALYRMMIYCVVQRPDRPRRGKSNGTHVPPDRHHVERKAIR